MGRFEGRLIAVDDSKDALQVIEAVAKSKGLGYAELPVDQLLELVTWNNVDLKQNDLVILDISFKHAQDRKKPVLEVELDLNAPEDVHEVRLDDPDTIGEIVDYPAVVSEVRPTVDYNGLDVFKYLVRWKNDGKLSGLTKLLLNTTLQTSLTTPDVLNTPKYSQGGFDVYTLRRNTAPHEQRVKTGSALDVQSYQSSLSDMVERIYKNTAPFVNGGRVVRR
ncbi:hypothetical protein J4216_05670 [Candidatus Woesearchaeota archaeon]|nr:hypothetical protein [Candidatus Woesearchaeota archaeon]